MKAKPLFTYTIIHINYAQGVDINQFKN